MMKIHLSILLQSRLNPAKNSVDVIAADKEIKRD